MSEQTGKVIYKSVMWLAIGAISVIALITPSVDSKGSIIGLIVFLGAVVTIQA